MSTVPEPKVAQAAAETPLTTTPATPLVTAQQQAETLTQRTASLVATKRLMFWLKLVMLSGISLIIFGHYLWVGAKLPETMGVQGIIIVALCCALGLILSLPTKIYLTLLLMQYENEHQAIAQHNQAQNGNNSGQQ